MGRVNPRSFQHRFGVSLVMANNKPAYEVYETVQKCEGAQLAIPGKPSFLAKAYNLRATARPTGRGVTKSASRAEQHAKRGY